MLYGGHITVFTDHKNLTFKTLIIQRRLRWRLYMDQFYLHLKYIAGKNNVSADCFSRFPWMAKDTEENSSIKITTRQKWNGHIVDFHNLHTPENKGTLIRDEVFVSHGVFPQSTTTYIWQQPIINKRNLQPSFTIATIAKTGSKQFNPIKCPTININGIE